MHITLLIEKEKRKKKLKRFDQLLFWFVNHHGPRRSQRHRIMYSLIYYASCDDRTTHLKFVNMKNISFLSVTTAVRRNFEHYKLNLKWHSLRVFFDSNETSM